MIVENFTAEDMNENQGWMCDEKNVKKMKKRRAIFAEWDCEAKNGGA